MKSLLIIFIVLLFLLTLLSSFGGSIKTSEPFYDANPAFQPTAPPSFDIPHPEKFETFTMNEHLNAQEMNENFTAQEVNEHFNAQVKHVYNSQKCKGKKECFYEDAAVPSLVPQNPQSVSSQPAQTTESYEEKKVEKFGNLEKFEIPEPFVDVDSQVGAPF